MPSSVSTVPSSSHCRGIDSDFSRPSRQRLGFAAVFHQYAVSAVLRLLLWGGPFAVFRRVTKAVVLALNGMLGARPEAHVVNEREESGLGISPALADGNSSRSVLGECSVLRDIAAAQHQLPCVVQRVVRCAMRLLQAGHALAVNASARIRVALTQATGGYDLFGSARAQTAPPPAARLVLLLPLKNGQATKLLTSQIDPLWHRLILSGCVRCRQYF